MSGPLRLTFVIEALDRATANVRKVSERIDKIAEPARRVRASFNSLLRESHLPRLAAQAELVGRRFGGVTSALRGIAAAGLIAAGAGAAIWLPLKNVIGAGSKIGDTANMLGVSAREFQRISYALTLDGGGPEDAAAALRFLQNNAVQALKGSKELQQGFEKLGLSAQFVAANLNNPIALLEGVADGMKKLPTQADRIAASQTLMSRSGARTVQTLSEGAAGLRRMGDEAEALGAVLDDNTVAAMKHAGDQMTRMHKVLGGVAALIASAGLPVVNQITAGVIKWALANRELIATEAGKFAKGLLDKLPKILSATFSIVAAIGTLIGVVDSIVQVFGGWEVAIGGVAALLVGKLIVAVALFAQSLGLLTVVTGKFGLVLSLTPLGWFLGAVALLAGAVYLVYRNWEPISTFFIGMWEAVKGAFTDAFEWIANKIGAVTTFVTSAITKLDKLTPDWVKRFTLPGAVLSLAADAVSAGASASPSALAERGASRTDVGGVIRIEFDHDGRPRVAGMRSNNPNVDFDVDSGPLLFGGGA